jgi:hypothetical protein
MVRCSVEVRGEPAITGMPAVSWATERLVDAALASAAPPSDDPAAVPFIEIQLVGPLSAAAHGDGNVPVQAESYSASTTTHEGRRRITVAATDERGYAYALSEIADRLRADGYAGLEDWQETESPAVPVRAIQRNFSSVHEDSPWFHDRAFWFAYLDHLAAQRFNRFQLAFGMQYNYGTGWESRTATDNYLVFTYPFLLDVPGFQVRAEGVTDAERDRNLESLAFIARETRRRGISFQLGLWNHAYEFGHESREWYPISGLDADTHADYCATALGALLRAIPEIDGITFRVHHEGGIHEGGREVFWGKLFDAASKVGRPLEIDMHAKGVDDVLVAAARKPNLRPVISAKHLAEHMGLAYHQASIRPREQTPLRFAGQDTTVTGVTDGARRFTRYGYADYLSEDRPTDVIFRMWPGTQKLLLWGDPALASGYGRYATLGGSRGLEFCEPLTFKGRRGSGEPGRRDPYVRDDLRLGVSDWKKYRYAYVLWGRLMYNPDADSTVWRRALREDYGDEATVDIEAALASLSRVLPLVAHVHGVSAANNFYTPELYVDLPISQQIKCMHYAWDTLDPRTWEGVSTFDPTLFAGIGEYADAAVDGVLDGRYTPLEVASWLVGMADDGQRRLDAALASLQLDDPQVVRTVVDLRIVIQLARFFAGKFRSAVEYALYRRTGDAALLQASVDILAEAHQSYANIGEIADGVYQDDIAFGVGLSDRGAWADRLGPMKEDLDALRAELASIDSTFTTAQQPVRRTERWTADAELEAADAYDRAAPLAVRLRTSDILESAVLHFRHLNQGETWQSAVMERVEGGYAAEIPAEYTDAEYPLTFFAEVSRRGDHPVFVPALVSTLSNQPYLVRYSSTWRSR